MNVRVSYEQKIIDALIALPRKRGEHCLDRFKREAAVMREILAPAYRAEADHLALVDALREVKRMAECHHASEPEHFLLHALLVEIPSYIDDALAALDAEKGA